MHVLLTALLAIVPSSSGDRHADAWRTFLSDGTASAATQFRSVKLPYGPHGAIVLDGAADTLFGIGAGRCEIDDYWLPANRLKLICGPIESVVEDRKRFESRVTAATPTGFASVGCPSSAEIVGQSFLSCTRRRDGVEIEAIVQAAHPEFNPPVPERFALRIVAPAPAIDRLARATALRRLLAAMTRRPSRILQAPDLVRSCETSDHPDGRHVSACTLQNGVAVSRDDAVAAIRQALPPGFRSSHCARHSLVVKDCSRGPGGTEVAVDGEPWPFVIYAYPVATHDPRIAKVREFFAAVLPLAEGGFRGYDPKALPYFGDCSDPKPLASRSFVSCSVRQDRFEDIADYESVVTDALPASFRWTTCVLDVSRVLGEDYSGDGCYSSPQHPEVQVGSDDAGYWQIWVLSP